MRTRILTLLAATALLSGCMNSENPTDASRTELETSASDLGPLARIGACDADPTCQPWILFPGYLREVGTTREYLVGTGIVPVAGGYTIHSWDKAAQNWKQIPGGAVKVDVGVDGTPYAVRSDNSIAYLTGTTWRVMPGSAVDIAVGESNDLYVLGTDAVPGGKSIHKWTGSSWSRITGGATALDVSPSGVLWVVNDAGNIFYREPANGVWVQIPGKGRDIAAKYRDTIYVVGSTSVAGGYHLWKSWNKGVTWIQSTNAGCVRVAVNFGQTWCLNDNNRLFLSQSF